MDKKLWQKADCRSDAPLNANAVPLLRRLRGFFLFAVFRRELSAAFRVGVL
jgi:hypothetical protein